MTYFRELPNVQYQSFLSDKQSSQDYILVKNIFRRAKIRDDLQNVFTLFNKYQIVDGTRPELVAEEIYGSVEYDWVVIIGAGITNIRDQWPLSNKELYDYCERVYGNDLNAIHHYETTEVKDSNGKLILPGGQIVNSNFKTYYYGNYNEIYTNDINQKIYVETTNGYSFLGSNTIQISTTGTKLLKGDHLIKISGEELEDSIKVTDINLQSITLESSLPRNISTGTELTFNRPFVVLISDPIIGISNYEYETIKNNEKGLIYLLKPEYLQTVLKDMRRELFYDESSQYIDQQTIRTENTYNTI
jgi:hypothetical protein